MVLHLCRRNKISPTCNAQALTWMIPPCSRKFGILGGKDVLEDHNLSLMADYKEIEDLYIQNGFLVMKFAKQWQLKMIFGKLISRYSSVFGTTQALQPQDQGPERPVRMCTAPDSCSW